MVNYKEHCDIILANLLGPRLLAEKWWNSPNKALGNKKPVEVDIREVFTYLYSQV
jgi:hypothetical protein